MKKVVWLLVLLGVSTSCEKTIHLDINASSPSVVIEGLLTNMQGLQYVKVSRSYGFYDTGEAPPVTNATVMVYDNQGNTIPFAYSDSKAGYYLPADKNFKGTVGNIYSMSVVVDGQTYQAMDTLLAVTPIDSLGYRINPRERNDSDNQGRYYEVLLFAKEPQDIKNYYLFQFFENDSLVRDHPSDVYFADDQMLGEKIDGVPSPVFFAPGDTARVEMYSLTRSGFLYYNDLNALLNNDGGMFSPPPVNCRTNLTNGALGLFQVSALSADTIIIKE